MSLSTLNFEQAFYFLIGNGQPLRSEETCS
jgi:hypothetical protein